MLSILAPLRRLTRLAHVPAAPAFTQPKDTQLSTIDPADTLDTWRGNDIDVPAFMCASTGAEQALRRPVLAVPSGHSMHAAEAEHLGVACVPNRVLRRAMEQFVAGDADWDEAVCPITLEPFDKPVQIASPFFDTKTHLLHIEDHAYELSAIEDWFEVCTKIAATLQGAMPTSPMTRAQLRYPITLVANLAVMDMCRARQHLPPLTEDEQRSVRRACREASLALNHRTGEARSTFQIIAGIVLGSAAVAFGVELFASGSAFLPPTRDVWTPPVNDTAFWRTCTGLDAVGAPKEWGWTPKAARQGCRAADARCRRGTSDLIEALCADDMGPRPADALWLPPRVTDLPDSLHCQFLRSACYAGHTSYRDAPHYVLPHTYAAPQDLWPYHVLALSVLAAGAVGAAALFLGNRNRRRPRQTSPV